MITITPGSDFETRIDNLEGIEPVVLVEIECSSPYNWLFSNRTLGSGMGSTGGSPSYSYSDYDPIITDMSDIEISLPDGEAGVALVSDFVFSIQNTNPVKNTTIASSALANDTLENKTVVVKQGFMRKLDGTDFPLSGFVTVYTGVVSDYTWDEREMAITVIDSTFKRHKNIPSTKITKTDYSGANDVPDDIVGEPYPLIYGTVDKAKGYLTKQTATGQVVFFSEAAKTNHDLGDIYIYDNDRFIRLYKDVTTYDITGLTLSFSTGVVEQIYRSTGNWITDGLVSGDPIEIIDSIYNDGNYTVVSVTTSTLVVASTVTNESSTPSVDVSVGKYEYTKDTAYRHKITFGNNSCLRAYQNELILSLLSQPIAWIQDDDATDGEQGINGDLTDYAHIASGAAGTYELKYRIQEFKTGGTILNIYCVCKAASTSVAGADTGAILYPVAEATSYGAFGTYASVTIMSGTITAYNSIDGSDEETDLSFAVTTIDDDLSKISRGLLCFISHYAAGATKELDIYDNYLRIDFTVDMQGQDFYADIEGSEFGGTWDSRKTATNLIEHPADVIEGLYRHELGLADADIDTTNFDAVSTGLSSWEFAAQILAEQNSREIIDTICKQATARQYKRYDGTESLKILDTSASSDMDFDSDNILADSLKVNRTALDKVYNEYYFHYNKKYATGEYESLIYVTADDNNFSSAGSTYEGYCTTSQTKYGTVNRLTIEADWIRDDATAEAFCKRLADYHYLRHYQANYKTFLRDGFPLELCDTCTIDNDWLPTSVKGSSKKWEITKLIKYLAESEIGVVARSHDGD